MHAVKKSSRQRPLSLEGRLKELVLKAALTSSSLLIILPPSSGYSATPVDCNQNFQNSISQDPSERSLSDTTVVKKTEAEAWDQASQALREIDRSVYGRKSAIQAIATAMLAREFVWMNGEPGGAKTFLARKLFEAAIRAIPENDKRVFILQFHKLISEGKITGFQKFDEMMKHGKYEIETDTSLVGDRFLYMIADEAEKSNAAVLNALLSVLNERKAFLGSRVVDCILASGVFTSNKTTGEFIQGFYSDRPSGEALLDRMSIKIHIPNQQVDAGETARLYQILQNSNKTKPILPIGELESLVKRIKLSKGMLKEIVDIARTMDKVVIEKNNQSRKDFRYGEVENEYFPANQFSNRSVRRMVQVFKAGFIVQQLMQGVPYARLRLKPEGKDLALLAQSALYVGPSGIRFKTYLLTETDPNGELTAWNVKIQSPSGSHPSVAVRYSPYDQRIDLLDRVGKTVFTLYREQDQWVQDYQADDFKGWTFDASQLDAFAPRIQQLHTDEAIQLAAPRFELEDGISKLAAKATIKERTANELKSIAADLQQFADILNRHFEEKLGESTETLENPKKTAVLSLDKTARDRRNFLRALIATESKTQKAKLAYEWMLTEVSALRRRFVELDHSIEAHLTGLLAQEHLYVFGPPGGAKTALAEVILKAELKKLNREQVLLLAHSVLEKIGKTALHPPSHTAFLKAVLVELRQATGPKEFERFLLQFHKLLPEGVLVGFPKIEKQLNEGREEIEVSTSLAAEKFIFAILDEVDKANPQTITALLSILNERQVFAGSILIQTALRTAILTSNKMPSEFLDSYHEDRSTGEAVMDRALNKVFVSNKIADPAALTQFLYDLEQGTGHFGESLLAVGELQTLVETLEFEGSGQAMIGLLAQIHQNFLGRRIQKEDAEWKQFKMDPREFPEYYVSAAGSASDRTFIKLVNQFKARFFIHQLMEGVPYSQLRTKIELKDLGLFFEGLGYWAPQKIISEYNSDGFLVFRMDATTLNKLLDSGVLDSRVRYHVEKMKEEGEDYINVVNAVVTRFAEEYKDTIAQYPALFPSLFRESTGHSGDKK